MIRGWAQIVLHVGFSCGVFSSMWGLIAFLKNVKIREGRKEGFGFDLPHKLYMNNTTTRMSLTNLVGMRFFFFLLAKHAEWKAVVFYTPWPSICTPQINGFSWDGSCCLLGYSRPSVLISLIFTVYFTSLFYLLSFSILTVWSVSVSRNQ